jgi:hypothetical protein
MERQDAYKASPAYDGSAILDNSAMAPRICRTRGKSFWIL